MDTALQQAALESYQEQGQHNGSLKRHKCHCRLDQGQELSQQRTWPPESQPIAQIAPDSFLGVALKNLERQGEDPSEDPTSSSSSSSKYESNKSQGEMSSYSSDHKKA